MTRSISLRLTCLLLAGAFLVAGPADVYGLLPCPHHDHRPAPSSTPDDPATGHTAHDAHGDRGDHDEDAPCTCVGSCHVSAGAPLATAPPAGETWLGSTRAGAVGPAEAVLPAGPPPFLTPYPTGPPLRS